jgi:hypothetical protein
MVVDACLGGWSGEIAGGQAPFGAWRGDACRRLRTCGPCRESRCSARPASAPRLRAQHGRRHSVVSLSLRLPGSVLLSCALVLLCAGPRRPHAMRRGDPGSYNGRVPPAFSFLPARCAPCRPRSRYDEGWTWTTTGLALPYARRFAAPLATCGARHRKARLAIRGPRPASIVASF